MRCIKEGEVDATVLEEEDEEGVEMDLTNLLSNVTIVMNLVKGLLEFQAHTKVCEDCLVGKQQRDPFPRKST